MNIQIFGTKKSSDTKKAERFFKERRIPFQSIDMKAKGISKGELTSVIQAVGSLDDLLDPGTKEKDALLLIQYSPDGSKIEKVLDNPMVLKQPIVRNGKKATVGHQPEIWKAWTTE